MKKILENILAIFILLLFITNLLITFIPLLMLAILKLIPFKPWKDKCSFSLNIITTAWMRNNILGINLLLPVKLSITGTNLKDLKKKDWYLVISNHQSWMDIVVLYMLFLGKIPFMKFFLKEQLKYIPMMGLAWWALDFPFMKRYSKSYIKKYPEKAGKDVEATKKACEKFKTMPIAIVNFMEGTRFSDEKKIKVESSYDNLLPPRAGGAAYVIGILGGRMKNVLDVTICYAGDKSSLWDVFCGRVKSIHVDVKLRKITEDLIGDYSDLEYRKHFIKWVNQLWLEKDHNLAELKKRNI